MHAARKTLSVLLVLLLLGTLPGCSSSKRPNKPGGNGKNTLNSLPSGQPERVVSEIGVELPEATFETAREATQNMRIGWNLGNALDSMGPKGGDATQFETLWGNPPITKELMQAVRNSGFASVRIPITWDAHMDENHTVDAAWLTRVEEVVNMALDEGLYCIINVHHDTGEGNRWLRADPAAYDQMSARFEALWRQIAQHFKGHGERLLFEGFNEITDRDSSKDFPGGTQAQAEEAYKIVNDLNQLFVDTVRGTGGNNSVRNLICSSYYASVHEEALSAYQLPKDTAKNHLMAQVHCFWPSGFTFKAVDAFIATDEFCGDCRANLDHAFAMMEKHLTGRNIPFIIGEFGAMDKQNLDGRAAYVAYFTRNAKELGAAAFWWDNGIPFEFGLLDRENCTALHPDILNALVAGEA